MGMHIDPFLFEGEHLVRAVERENEPWFVGLDICRILGIRDHTQALERLDPDERGGYNVPTPSGDQTMIIVSEPGIYRLVFTSRKPVAERLKRWLAHEVIPAIRKTGSYSLKPDRVLLPEDKQPFPEWPLEEMRTKCKVVDTCRILHGVQAAQWLWPQLGFPTPPLDLVERGRQYSMTLTFPEGDAGHG